MQCPICTDHKLVIAERQGVEIDYCPQCRGIWLDRGELDKIIERSNTHVEVSQAQAASFEKHYEKSPKKGRKRDSFLSDLFDF